MAESNRFTVEYGRKEKGRKRRVEIRPDSTPGANYRADLDNGTKVLRFQSKAGALRYFEKKAGPKGTAKEV